MEAHIYMTLITVYSIDGSISSEIVNISLAQIIVVVVSLVSCDDNPWHSWQARLHGVTLMFVRGVVVVINFEHPHQLVVLIGILHE